MLLRLVSFSLRPLVLVPVLLAVAVWLIWLWQPERQVRLHHQNFLKAVSDKKWNRAAGFISEGYADRWGHDKAFLIREGGELTRHYFILNVQSTDETVTVEHGSATVRARIRLAGTGDPIAQIANDELAKLSAPFLFDWKHTGWLPWQWELTRFDQPQLHVPDALE